MARIPSVAQLTRRLNDLKQRDAALKIRQQQAPKVGSGQPRPTQTVKYGSIFTGDSLLLNAPRAGINFFGGSAALGLAAPDDSFKAPKGFAPAKIKAVKGRASGKEKTADLSKRKYLKYSIDADGETQASFTAPISADTVATLKTRYQTIARAKADDIGEYGRISFEPERPVYSISGVAAGAAAPAP